MEIIESFQAFENLADRTFRGRSLGYQDEYEPEVDVAERSNAWRYEEKSFHGPPLAPQVDVGQAIQSDHAICASDAEGRILF
jgi:hypothetical protein